MKTYKEYFKEDVAADVEMLGDELPAEKMEAFFKLIDKYIGKAKKGSGFVSIEKGINALNPAKQKKLLKDVKNLSK